jgi:hypothetical protein
MPPAPQPFDDTVDRFLDKQSLAARDDFAAYEGHDPTGVFKGLILMSPLGPLTPEQARDYMNCGDVKPREHQDACIKAVMATLSSEQLAEWERAKAEQRQEWALLLDLQDALAAECMRQTGALAWSADDLAALPTL